MRTWIYAVVIPVLFVQLANAAQEAGDMEKPPVLKAADLAPRDVPLKGEHYRVDDAVPTDGYLAAFTLKTDFGTVEARGPGVLRTRVAEVAAIAELEKMEASDVFVDAVKRSAASLGGAVGNVVTNPVEVAKAVPASVGRLFERVSRQAKTAAQNIGDAGEDQKSGASKQDLAGAGGSAGRAVMDVLGYDDQRRQLAKKLGVDPYTTNPILKKKLDEVARAAFAGGLSVNLLTAKVPGSKLIQSTSLLSDWIYGKSPGDLKVWMEKTLKEIGVYQKTIDLFLRQKHWTLTTQTGLVMALEKLGGVEGRGEVLDTAVAAEDEDQARFLAVGLVLLAREHAKTPIKAVIDGKPVGLTRAGRILATLPLDYVCWTERTAKFVAREDFLAAKPEARITGRFSPRALNEIKKLGWEVREGIPLANGF